MFTGLIEDVGEVKKVVNGVDGAELWVATQLSTADFTLGESISVDGVCLTVKRVEKNIFVCDVSKESLSRSTLKDASAGRKVNLERAMKADARFGGHFVLGHVDGTGKITRITPSEKFAVLQITAPAFVLKYVVEKGSIALDGISLTVNEVFPDGFSVTVIPETLSKTTLPYKKIGDAVNLEADIIGKYVEKFVSSTKKDSGITMEKLITEGYLRK